MVGAKLYFFFLEKNSNSCNFTNQDIGKHFSLNKLPLFVPALPLQLPLVSAPPTPHPPPSPSTPFKVHK